MNIIDEAGAVTLLESLIVWNGDTPLILVGDNNQLPPPVMTARQQFANKKPVNDFYKQLQQPPLHALGISIALNTKKVYSVNFDILAYETLWIIKSNITQVRKPALSPRHPALRISRSFAYGSIIKIARKIRS